METPNYLKFKLCHIPNFVAFSKQIKLGMRPQTYLKLNLGYFPNFNLDFYPQINLDCR